MFVFHWLTLRWALLVNHIFYIEYVKQRNSNIVSVTRLFLRLTIFCFYEVYFVSLAFFLLLIYLFMILLWLLILDKWKVSYEFFFNCLIYIFIWLMDWCYSSFNIICLWFLLLFYWSMYLDIMIEIFFIDFIFN